MNIFHLFSILLFACTCQGGPLVMIVAEIVVDAAVEEAAVFAATLANPIVQAVGIGSCSVFFENFVVVNGVLYYGSTIAGVGALGGASIGAGVGASQRLKKVKDAKLSSSIMAAISSSSAASVASVASVSRVSASHASNVAYISAQVDSARASVQANTGVYDPANDPFKFTQGTVIRNDARATQSVAPSQLAPPPNAIPVGTLAEDQRPPGFPEGVNLYNVQMCQNAIIHMNVTGKSLLFDQPAAKSLSVGNIPSECMALADHLLPHAELGPHPIPMGNDKLQWDNIHSDTIELVRQAFGVPFTNGSSSALKRPLSDNVARWKT